MAHCKALLIHCMDFRFTESIRDWMASRELLGNCDVVACAGAAKGLVDGTLGEKAFLLQQIKVSQELHGIGEVILMHHSDCGAYKKAAYEFNSQEYELGVHAEDMNIAAQEIKNNFKDLRTRKVFASRDKAGKVRFIDL